MAIGFPEKRVSHGKDLATRIFVGLAQEKILGKTDLSFEQLAAESLKAAKTVMQKVYFNQGD